MTPPLRAARAMLRQFIRQIIVGYALIFAWVALIAQVVFGVGR